LCTKRRFCAEIGVPFVWTVDPIEQLLIVERLHEGRWLELGVYADDERVRAQPFEDLEIGLCTWWE
jgi:Uma2 family endonuclease